MTHPKDNLRRKKRLRRRHARWQQRQNDLDVLANTMGELFLDRTLGLQFRVYHDTTTATW